MVSKQENAETKNRLKPSIYMAAEREQREFNKPIRN